MLRNIVKTVLLAALIATPFATPLFAAPPFAASPSGQHPVVGTVAPAFTLSTPDGQPVSLASLANKETVVLVVLRGYPGYQCPFCTRQVHDFIENAAAFNTAHAQVLLVYPGPPAQLDQHAKEFLVSQNPLPANMHLVIDPDYTFTNAYGLRWDAPHETAYPSTFLIDQKGTIFFSKISTGHGDRTTAKDILAELHKTAH